MIDTRGSSWAKWDLHVHTPESVVQHFNGTGEDAWTQYLTDLESLPPEFKVIGANDYFFIEGYQRLMEEKKSGRLANLDLILPVVELRLNMFGGTRSSLSRVNAHVIFSEALDPQVIKDQFISALGNDFALVPEYDARGVSWSGAVSRSGLTDLGTQIIESVPESERHRFGSPLHEGFANLTVSLERVRELIDNSYFKGRALIGVGKTEWADVKWTDSSIADKKNVVNRAQVVFVASESPAAYHRAREALSRSEVNSHLLDCSDAHHNSDSDEKDRIGNCATWIKAARTFAGLTQALTEFDRRVFVGVEPPEVRRARENPSRFIDSVKIGRSDGAPSTEWFDTELPLHPGMVAIIGNRGSGKSALAEAIALAGKTDRFKEFSFLSGSKFREPKRNPAREYTAVIRWKDGAESRMRLSDDPDQGSTPEVQHLPQRYLEQLCNELPQGQRTEFDRQLERIIFDHLPRESRLGADTLEERIDLATAKRRTQLETARERLRGLSLDIVRLEQSLSEDEREARATAYHRARKDWLALRRSPPAPVPEPSTVAPQDTASARELARINRAHGHLSEMWEAVRSQLAALRRLLAQLDGFAEQIRAIGARHRSVVDSHIDLLRALGLDRSISTIATDFGALDAARSSLVANEAELAVQLDATEPRSFPAVLASLEQDRASIRSALAAPTERYQEYLARVEEWKAECRSRFGSRDQADTVLGLRRRLMELRTLPAKLEAARESRLEVTRNIHELLLGAVSEYSELYRPLADRMSTAPLPDEQKLAVDTALVDEGFADEFLEARINRNVAGSFCGVDQSRDQLGRLTEKVDWAETEEVIEFVDAIHDRLHFDYRDTPHTPVDPGDQLRKGMTVEAMYDYLFGLEYLSPRYALKVGTRPIYQLSPGEKGVLLLVFFLLADLDTRPLILDQPEDNLDNQTVYRALVGCFHAAKERRQVIIVTHNPNLAVVCDADQVVVASMAKAPRPMVDYVSGPIESGDVAQAIVDVLEGTKPAFRNRRLKYDLHAI